jgi:tetrapyrrole methylase family protein/MazG family protein
VGDRHPRVTVVGLGPAGATFLTDDVVRLMDGAQRSFLRTARHPAADGLTGAVALDHLYESAGTFEEVYAAIVEVVVAAAQESAPVPIVYAVPGSPLVAERTVELLRGDARVDLTIVPGLSFLDLAWERLGVDPLGAGVRLMDAAQFPHLAQGQRGPFLVAQCWSRALLSEVKLSVDLDGDLGVPEVVLLHHLGLDDERVVRVDWWELDRTVEPDHLTTLYIPELPVPVGADGEMAQLERLVATLRARCPWDRAQSHRTLMPHLVEESYEVLDALRELVAVDEESPGAESTSSPSEHLREELGDLLFQIVFHSRLAQEEGRFTLGDVARGVHDKLVHRHPHVFGDVEAETAEQVIGNWEEIKKEEKGRASVTEGIPMHLPALLLATKLQRKALSVGWPGAGDSGLRLGEMVEELERLGRGGVAPGPDSALAADDSVTVEIIGELLFGVADLSRRLGIDPEQALRSRALGFRDQVVALESARERTRRRGVRNPLGRAH